MSLLEVLERDSCTGTPGGSSLVAITDLLYVLLLNKVLTHQERNSFEIHFFPLLELHLYLSKFAFQDNLPFGRLGDRDLPPGPLNWRSSGIEPGAFCMASRCSIMESIPFFKVSLKVPYCFYVVYVF